MSITDFKMFVIILVVMILPMMLTLAVASAIHKHKQAERSHQLKLLKLEYPCQETRVNEKDYCDKYDPNEYHTKD